MPTMPPSAASTIASIRQLHQDEPARRPPSALAMLIARVRSVTDR